VAPGANPEQIRLMARPSPTPLAVLELHAAGLGLMLYSPARVVGLEVGADYMPAGEMLWPPLDALVGAHDVVFLGTGSPQLDYQLRVFTGAAPLADADTRVDFGLRIGGGALCARDGYDAMDWSPAGESLRTAAVADGAYAVTAVWRPGGGVMRIDLYLQLADGELVGDGWPYLAYRV
jgi:hypothetical protein